MNSYKYYKIDVNILILAWLSDKIVGVLENEPLAKEALREAERKIDLLKSKKN